MSETTQRPLAVFDIDGVLADVEHRLHHIENKPKNWKAFFAEAVHDQPHPTGFALLEELAEDHDIVFLTGRPENCRRQTESWLAQHGAVGPVHMRPKGNFRPAAETKSEQLAQIASERTVAVVVEDDPRVVETHRAKGFHVVHATWMPHKETLRRAQEDEGRT